MLCAPMALQIGIVGLPNVGKSTLFNALTRTRGAQAANYPFCTIDPNVGIVEVRDQRLSELVRLVEPKKSIPATVRFVDIAGLVKGASQGQGLGNQFLHHIREVDAICHVVRAFTGGDIIHVEGSVDPKRDREIIETELCLADLDSVRKRLDKSQGAARTGDVKKRAEVDVLQRVLAALEQGMLAGTVERSPDEALLLADLHLLTDKPIIYAINVAENDLKTAMGQDFHAQLGLPSTVQITPISAKIEEDLQDLTPEDASVFLQDLGVTSSGLDRLIDSAYAALGLQTFFTAGVQEVRAWTVHVGATAPQAAGVIHTDFEKGFICAETISYKDFVQFGSEQKAKEAGKMRQEGKGYVVQDGDIFHFRFNV